MNATSPSAQSLPPAPAVPNGAGARWQVRLLGGLDVSDGTRHYTRMPSRAISALLARLALWPERAHAREQLVELLWPGVALDVGRNRLRQALSALKGLLEPAGCESAPVLQADRLSVRVAAGALACDAGEFEVAVREGRAAQALALYRGELLPGFYDEWIGEERARLAVLHERIANTPASAALASPVGTRRPPGADAAELSRAALPVYLTRGFGTDVQAARLRGQLQAHRLVTLVGPGGSGKTRLAVELAQSLRDSATWPIEAAGPSRGFDPIAFVPLVSTTTRAQAIDALFSGLQIGAQGEASLDRLVQALAGRRALLVLDNFEQLVGVAEDVVAHLAARLPGLHLLVTSRRCLGLDGEREFSVAPLDLPVPSAAASVHAASNPAVALFVDRARAVRADFQLGAGNHAAIVELVRVLEGMPLAIELAASRVRSFSPADMLALLRRAGGPDATPHTTPGLDLLARSGPRGGLDPRHASMQSVIAWSWRQLTPPQVRLMGALTVFHGGCTAAALRAMHAGDDAMHAQICLDELQAQSMVHSRGGTPARADAELRFQLYEPIREYAAAQLDDPTAKAWRERHRHWALAWARSLPTTPGLDELRAEMPNIAAALASANHDGAAEDAVHLLLALRRALEDVELPADGLVQAVAAVQRCTDPVLRSLGHTLLGPMLFAAGQKEAALRHAHEGLNTLPPHDPVLRARALHALARVHWRSSRDAASVEPLLDEARALIAQADEPEVRADIQALRAFVANRHHHDHAGAQALQRQALRVWQAMGNQHAVNGGRYNLAVIVESEGRHELALQALADIIQSARALHDWRRLSQALNVSGNALSELRRWPEAVAAFRECTLVAWRSMAPHDLAYGLWNLPRALAHVRRPEAAVQIAAFAAQFWQTRFGLLGEEDHFDLRRVRRLAAMQIGHARVAALWSLGERLALPDAVALSLAA
jgi:predicted ATPase